MEMTKWRRKYLGSARMKAIRRLRNTTLPLKQHDLEDIQKSLRASYQSMLAQRAAGESGWLEFNSPYPDGVQ